MSDSSTLSGGSSLGPRQHHFLKSFTGQHMRQIKVNNSTGLDQIGP